LDNSVGWWKRTRGALTAAGLLLSVVLTSGGFAGCVVKEDGDDDATGGNKDRPTQPDAGETGAGAQPGEGGAPSSGGTSNQGGDDSGDAGSPASSTGGTSGGSGTGGSAPKGGSGGGGGLGDGSGVKGAETGTWTYLVYMLADNDLERFALQDLEEMMAVGSGGKLTILAQVDRAVGESNAPVGGLSDFTSTKRVRVDENELVELEDIGETNMGQSATLSEFLSWGIETAPSQHYAVIFWDHGAAWPQFGLDFSAGTDGLTLPELVKGLDDGAAAGKLQGPLDFVGFDACLMANWEVGVALQNRARYMLASEEVEPGHGWDHRSISLLEQGAEARELGEALIDGYRDQATDAGTLPRVTLSLTDLSKMPAVSEALGALGTALSDDIATHAVAIGKSRADAPTFGQIPGASSSEMTDLALWAQKLGELDSSVSSEASALRSAISSAVVDKTAGSAHPSNLGGLSIYFPPTSDGYRSNYDQLEGISDWRELLSSFYTAASETTSSAPVFTNPDKLASVTALADGLLVEGQLQQGSYENLTTALIYTGLFLDDTGLFLGEEQASVSDTGLVSATWDKTVLFLTQDGVSDFGYYSIEAAGDDAFTLSVPLKYREGDEEIDAVLILAFDLTGTVLTQGLYAPTEDSWAELVPAAGSRVAPVVPFQTSDANDLEWLALATEFDASTLTEIDLEFLELDPGTEAFVALVAQDFAGEGDTVSAVGTL
jgi:hypothetical protein